MNFPWLLSVLGLTAAALRVVHSKLTQRFRLFFVYLCLSVASAGALALAGKPSTQSYLVTWLVFDPILQVALLLAVAEVVDLVYSEYPRLGSFGLWLLGACTVVSLALCFGTAMPEMVRWDALSWSRPIAKFIFLAHRWTTTIALGSLVLVFSFLARYRRPIAPTILRHAVIMLVYLASHAAEYFIVSFRTELREVLNSAQLLTSAACGVAWVVSLRPAGTTRSGRETSIEELDEARARHEALLEEMRRTRPFE